MWNPTINGNSRILNWRYCTIFLAIFCWDIPLHRLSTWPLKLQAGAPKIWLTWRTECGSLLAFWRPDIWQHGRSLYLLDTVSPNMAIEHPLSMQVQWGKSIFKWVIILCHVWLPEGIECLWSCPCSLMLLTLCDHPIKLSQLMRTPNMLSSCDISDVILCYTHKKWLVDILPTNKTMKRCFMVGCISVVLPHMF